MKKALILVYITGFLIGISYGMHGPLLPVFAKNEIFASYTELGLIGLANFIPYMFIPLFVGIFLDRVNNGYLLSIGVAINSASLYLLSLAQSVPEIIGFRIMTGIAHAFFWPPSESIISNASPVNERVQNIAKFTGFFVTGFMIGPLIGTVLLESFDLTYRLIFQVAAFILAASIISALSVSQRKITIHNERFSFSSIKEMVNFPQVIIMLIFCTASFGMILSIYPAFLDDKSMSGTDIEILYFIFGVSRVVTLFGTKRLAKKTSHTLIFATFSISFGLAISFFANSFFDFAIALLLMGFGFSIFFPLTLEIILSKTRKGISGTIIGAYETTFGIGWAIGPVTAGFISQFQGNEVPYLVFCLFGVCVTILSILNRKSLEPKRNVS